MSTQPEPESPDTEQRRPERYTDGEDRYINFIQDFFGVDPTMVQRRLLRSVANNRRTVAVGGNGPGKSFIAAMLNGAFLYTNDDSICMPTSGTYSVLEDTLWKPLQSRVKRAKQEYGLPGRCLQSPPRVRIDDEWYLKAVSPTHPSNLEGRHAGTMLITLEEADKPDIGMDHIDSAESMVTSDQDRMLVIANPPADESNCVYELMEDDNWETIQFSSFESRNVRIDAGEIEGEKTPGLVDMETIKTDWVRWNNEPWPGLEQARRAHEERTDLDTRWYRRRAGVIPPVGAEAHRPFYIGDVNAGVEREPALRTETVLAIGIDVARKGGDETVMGVLFPTHVDFYAWRDADHSTNLRKIEGTLQSVRGTPPLAIDAVGEGSALADQVLESYDEGIRFKAGQKAIMESEYYNRWTEGLVALGSRIEESVSVRDDEFREELFACARAVELEENHRRSGDVLRATSKSVLKDQLGRSPDRLDAGMMAAWAAYVDEMGPEVESPRHTQMY